MTLRLNTEDNIYIDSYDMMKNLLLYVIIQFPISSMLKMYIIPLNIMLTGMVFILFFIYFVRYRMKKREFYLAVYIILTLVQNFLINGLSYYENNMLFYLPFLILYFCFFVRNTSYIYTFMLRHKKYIDIILFIWNIAVAISFAIPSCYVYEGETRGFVSFVKSTFLLSPIAIYIFALLVFQYCIYRKIGYVIGLIVPSLCVLMGTSRTYLVVLFCAWIVFIYIILKNKKWFVPVIVFASMLFVAIVLVSPIKSKFIDVLERVDELGLETSAAFTSGRTDFWMYDIQKIFSNNVGNIIFGNGVNYLFNINKEHFHVALWAHNDFIQILSDYGLLGLGVYIYILKYLLNSFIKKSGVSKALMLVVVFMWIFNAFFNMFYTYFCAVLSFPFFLLSVKVDLVKKEEITVFEGE